MTGIEKAVALAGGQATLATILGVSQPAVSRWVTQGWVPVRYWAAIGFNFGIMPRDLAHEDLRAYIDGGK